MNLFRRLVSISLAVVCFLGVCLAQDKTAGTFYVYDQSKLQALTPAPEGFEPFYVSHFGRHGARYCTSEYDSVYDWFSKAAEKDLLTDAGKAFFSRYKPFYQKVKLSKGNLTGVGKAQHRDIARNMYQRFPAVFEGPTHVEAVSTESARVIMSMWSFLSQLQALDQDLDISADASAKYAYWLQPSLSSNPYLIENAMSCGKAADKASREFFAKTVPSKAIVGRFFKDGALKTLEVRPEKVVDRLFSVASSTYCLDQDRGCFDDLFSAQESQLIWKAQSADYFTEVARYIGSESLRLDYIAFTLGQIIETADADIASGRTQLRLRFGHDSGIAPLLVLLDVNGCGRATDSFQESLEIFPNYMIPMGASLQLVFYRNASGDVLVKALVNEEEATLPLEAVSGPYYKWADFKAHYLPIVRASKRKVMSVEPLKVLGATDWGWKPVGDSKVEVGGAQVKVFGSVQTISMARVPLGAHRVEVVESDGPSALITSRFGEKNKALAAINGSYFDGNVYPVTYVKDEGRVVCNRTSDEAYRCNGMFRIRDRKGSKIDIVTVDSLSIVAAAKGWREAIVSGPVLLEDGVPVDYENDGSRSYRRFYDHRHPRTLLGYTADGVLYFIVVDGRFPAQADGMTIFELEVLCQSLGLYEALNLDGGGSSTLWARGSGVLNHPYDNKLYDHEGERTVPNAIIVK